MRYLLLIVFVAILGACQNPKIETLESKIRTLEAEKAGLVLLYEKEVDKTVLLANQANSAAAEATEARANAELALEDAMVAQATAQESARLALIAQAEAELQREAFLKCKEENNN